MNLHTLLHRTLAACAFAAAILAAPQYAAAAGHWSAAWYTPPFPPTSSLIYDDVRYFGNQTTRDVIRVEAGGEKIRLRLTNELGLSDLPFAAVHVAISSPTGVIDTATDRAVTFSGKPGAVIARGKALLSDPIDLRVAAFQHVAVSVFYRQRVAPSGHLAKLRISKTGNHCADEAVPLTGIHRAPTIVSGIDVETAKSRKVLVAFGDSITEGYGSTGGIAKSWPQQFAVRLAKTKHTDWTVINSGISGNRLLQDGAGPKALDRFDRDALEIPGAKAIVLLEGINDIGAGSVSTSDTGPRSPSDIIGAYKTLIARAHAKGLKIYGATMTPYRGSGYFSEAGEKTREAVNDWIRTSGAFDGVIDFDAVMRDPARPQIFIPADHYGDYLHPNDDGYAVMAKAIDPELFTRGVK